MKILHAVVFSHSCGRNLHPNPASILRTPTTEPTSSQSRLFQASLASDQSKSNLPQCNSSQDAYASRRSSHLFIFGVGHSKSLQEIENNNSSHPFCAERSWTFFILSFSITSACNQRGNFSVHLEVQEQEKYARCCKRNACTTFDTT